MNIQGITALITGASRGIGRAIALELARNGVGRLLLVARDRQKLAELAAELSDMEVEVITLALDLTQPTEVNIALAQAWRTHGPIDLLVNCAGVAHQTPFLKSKLPQVQEELSLNLMGLYTVTRAIARRMATRNQGTIVNVSSLMGKIAAPTMSTYSATKFAILGFTEALRSELAQHNIKVMALLPTLTDTDMTRRLQLFRWVTPMTPQQVAQVLIIGLRKDSPEILVGWQSHLAVWCRRIAPWVMNKVLKMASPLSRNYPESPTAWRRVGAASR
ncbi:SDR family NAD(P)-dependent oxidoreductase [Limnospira fusiformis KN01]|uniref:3-oxoacyl-[acyl-carrier-protein] reductase, fabG-like n=1 Tax=Limnospira indica PCC 8005 TaxID=376219 RepID=A0A9P1P0F3_9CYAN|nr:MULTISPECIES: SDR family NAD(P)-dependent oxidoreductase [Limnospira]MDT9199615.1 SDR family NAD(P)-dependent oxidoreductase [Limnospira sp. PMC 1042.18]ULB47030.1 SDR family NAD(P)-dependent oxidoreductase [Limnospira fusiformis KN01]CDM96366.1 3-oxoacyl-[acyl-carrier-protein] reductase, fabG-like [Limnospira indica PCC 8005]